MVIYKTKLFLKSFFFALTELKYPLSYFFAILSDKKGQLVFNNGHKLFYDDAGSLGLVVAIFKQKMYGDDLKDKVVIDIGANMGYFTLAASIQGAKKVYSYEPIKDTITILNANIIENSLEENIKTYNLLVGSENKEDIKIYTGTSKKEHSIDNHEHTSKYETVKMISLESILSKHVEEDNVYLLKLNCEGSEYDILLNSPKSIFRRIKHIRLEFHNFIIDGHESHISSISIYLISIGYKEVRSSNKEYKHGIIWFTNSLIK